VCYQHPSGFLALDIFFGVLFAVAIAANVEFVK